MMAALRAVVRAVKAIRWVDVIVVTVGVSAIVGVFSSPLWFIGVAERIFSVPHGEHETLAHYGESFIVWHSLFDAAACILLAMTLVFQFREGRGRERQIEGQLKLQRDNLDTYKSELEAQRIQGVFFPLLRIFTRNIRSLRVGSLRGQAVFREWRRGLDNGQDIDKSEVFRAHGLELKFYQDHLHMLVKCLKGSTVAQSQKVEYLLFLLAQLSDDEHTVLAAYRQFVGDRGRQFESLVRELGGPDLRQEVVTTYLNSR